MSGSLWHKNINVIIINNYLEFLILVLGSFYCAVSGKKCTLLLVLPCCCSFPSMRWGREQQKKREKKPPFKGKQA